MILTGFVSLSLSACGAAGSADEELGSTSSVELALTSVPSGVSCIRMVLSGSTSRTVDFNAPYPNPSVLDLGPLSAGQLTIMPSAYNGVTCASVTSTTPVTWVSDGISVTARAGLTTSLSVTLRPNVSAKATVGFVIPASAVATSANSSYALMQDGTIRAWGLNASGQIGDGSYLARNAPVTVSGITTATRIAAGANSNHVCAVLASGSASCWGNNTFGQLGNGTTTASPVPVPVTMPAGVTFLQIATGAYGTCALGSDKFAYCWGDNTYGEVGDGTTTNRSIPTKVSGSMGFIDIRVGDIFACARTAFGSATCWGYNASGQFGNYDTSTSYTPGWSAYYPIVGFTAGSNHTCAISPTGSATCAGDNGYGQLGIGSTAGTSGPTQVQGITNAAALSAGVTHTCAVHTDGAVSCWGNGYRGQVGDGASNSFNTLPRSVFGLTGATAIGCGSSHSCALQSDGLVSCWGDNSYGQLGDSTNVTRFVPVKATL